MNNPDKMKFETPNLTAENVAKIAELFPGAVTEGKVNVDLLRSMLGEDVYGDEAYEFTWVGKHAAIAEAGRPIRKTLRPCVEESKDWDTTENLYIEGDNLDVLKLLQESYLGKVKMIYIDPPYNTGKDSFVYRDKFAMGEDEYEEAVDMYDENGLKMFRENNKTNPRFHSDWCSMIYPTLVLARNVLRPDGVIFISIDDNQVHDLRKICDEIFGADNFIGCAGRISKKANNQGDYWAPNFDYLLTYTKNIAECAPFFGGVNYSAYNLVEEDGPRKGEKYQLVRLYMTSLDPMRGCSNQRYYIECPDGTFIIPPGNIFPAKAEDGAFIPPQSGQDKVWRWSYASYLEKKDSIVVKKGKSSNVVGVDGTPTLWNAFTKTYLNDVISKQTATPNSFIENHINQNASHELKKLGIPFDFAKPSSLMKYLAEICMVKDDDIVLDFFSGSSSTADSIMQLNASDCGKRRFIMVQLPEPVIEEKSKDIFNFLKENNLLPVICEIGKERIRRAGDKIKAEAGLAAQNLDIGFRVLKLDDTNMNEVYYAAGDYTQDMISLLESNIKPDRNDMDLLFGCLLDWGLPLSMPHTSEKIDDFTVHTYNEGDLIACFEERISEKAVREIANRKPLRAVFRDSSFTSSPEKINVFEIFKLLAPNTAVRVI